MGHWSWQRCCTCDVLPSFAILAVLGGGALLFLVLYGTQKAKMTIRLSYKGKLDEETSARFSEVREALEGLASSGRVWRLAGFSAAPEGRRGSTFSRAGAGEGRTPPYAWHQGRHAGLGDRGRR